MADIARQLLKIWEEYVSPIWEEYVYPLWSRYVEPILVFFGEIWSEYFSDYWSEHGTDLIIAPLFIPAVFFWFFVGNVFCPKRVRDLTDSLPFVIGMVIKGIIGIPFYIFSMILAGVWAMLGAFWLILSLPLRALGIVKVQNRGQDNEPKTNTQVDMDE